MLERLVTFALSQRVFVLAAAVILVVFGWYAVSNLPIEAFPDVQDVQVNIVTQAQGLAPEEVERSISLPIEREMNGVPRMPLPGAAKAIIVFPTMANPIGNRFSSRLTLRTLLLARPLLRLAR